MIRSAALLDMLERWYAKVTEALVETLWWNVDEDGPEDVITVRRVADFVAEQQGRMPDYLRLPMFVLTLACDLRAMLGRGHRFHKLPLSTRRELVGRWRSSRWGVWGDFVRFYESLSVFGGLAEREEPPAVLPVS